MSSDSTLGASRLADEASSYLRRHAHQPVEWYPWGAEALHRAAEEGRPILLSIGYSSNHWCAKMERESFEDERVAALMNARFLCVKVDREERPDIDAYYLEALSLVAGDVGHPVTMFLTPDGKPFYGGSYYPPEARDGLQAFEVILNEAATLWESRREETLRRARDIERELGRTIETPRSEPLSPVLLQRAVESLEAAADEVNGGFGVAPKFPQPAALEFLLRFSGRGAGRASKLTELTLTKMALGGLFDQLGGGFHRLARDAEWRVPHFEKMLYDNALLGRLYVHAWQQFRKPLYRRIALDTAEYLIRDLASPAGPFYASESADSEGGEGAFYTWTREELQSRAPDAADYFGAAREGNFEGLNVLTAASEDPPGKARAALFKHRLARPKPARDEKVLTSWNGLAISALAEAGAAFDRLDLIEAARRAAGYLLERHRDRATGRLYHSYRSSERRVAGMLEDYAYLAEGLYTLWEVSFEPPWIQLCDQLCREMLELFGDDREGGLYTTAPDHEPLIPRRKEYLDSGVPSAAAVASTVLHKLGVLLGDQELRRGSAEIVEAAGPQIEGHFLDACAMLSAIDLHLSPPTTVVIVGTEGDARTRALRQELWAHYLPNKVCAGSPPGIRSPLLEGKTLVDDSPAAYVAQGDMTKPPVKEAAELDGALRFWTPPSTGQVSEVTGAISNALRLRHFFDNLKNPAWIQPLRQAGLFDTAPDPIYDYTEETVGSPPWAQSRYLARMAPFSPKEVQEVSLQVRDAGNVQVHEDLADVALAIPTDLASSFVPKAKEWLQSPYQLHLPEKLGALLRRLAEGGRIEEALELTAALLEVKAEENPQARDVFQVPPEPRAKFRKFDYEQILEKEFPALVKAAPLKALAVLCELLESAIHLSFREGEDRPPIDYSHLWRPAIYPTEQNADKTLRESLAAVLVESVEQIARDQPLLVPKMVELLESRGRHIFTRTALHLLRVWPETAPELISSHLMNRRLFEDPHFHHEYLLLVREHFEELAPDQQSTIFQWIAEGPDLELWRSDPDSPMPEDDSLEIAERYRERWRLKRLSLLEEYLPEAERDMFERLTQAHGPEENAEYVAHYRNSRADPTTPIQAEDLHFHRIQEVLDFLETWRPTPGLGNPTVEGLAMKLAQVVATEPAKFAKTARRFKGLAPEYVWALLEGLREGGEGFSFDWAPVLDLCDWTVAESEGGGRPWRAARMEVARLLSRGFSQGVAQMPFELRPKAWKVLRPLTDDPDPEEAPGGEHAADASQLSVSTVRGEALHAVVRYALWVRRYLESDRQWQARLKDGLALIPEVRDVLERHLQVDVDPSPAIRAVYGRWFAWLVMLDAPWATARVGEVFPKAKELEPLRNAAWEALISFSPAYDYLPQLLGAEYERGVDLISRFEQRAEQKVHPENRLAEHLMVFYLRGKLAFAEKELLSRFFSQASVKLRRHALGFVGRSLNNQEGRLPADFEMRLSRLWERRVKAVEGAPDPSQHFEELSAFGWWFASGKLNESWALAQLRKILQLGVRIENSTAVIGKLKEYAGRRPGPVLECLGLILHGERDSVSLLAWAEDSQSIINAALESSDEAARTRAVELMSFFDVRELEELVRWD